MVVGENEFPLGKSDPLFIPMSIEAPFGEGEMLDFVGDGDWPADPTGVLIGDDELVGGRPGDTVMLMGDPDLPFSFVPPLDGDEERVGNSSSSSSGRKAVPGSIHD